MKKRNWINFISLVLALLCSFLPVNVTAVFGAPVVIAMMIKRVKR